MAAQDDQRQRARDVVREIVESHGDLEEEDLAQLSSPIRSKILKRFRIKDEMIGSTIITYAHLPTLQDYTLY
jgi:hypothetical protein